MAHIRFQKPTDQPFGSNRLLDSLRQALNDKRFSRFRFMVAFAKVGPLLRLQPDIERWQSQGNRIEAVIGIDQNGTSYEAVEFALTHFTSVHIAHVVGPFSPTFHPKLYLFDGGADCLAFIGSNNMTVGGTETNLESHVRLELSLPNDSAMMGDLQGLVDDALQIAAAVTPSLLKQLLDSRLVLRESQLRRLQQPAGSAAQAATTSPAPVFPTIQINPPSAVPRDVARARAQQPAAPSGAAASATPASTIAAQSLVIQIKPRDNGEILLSKTAVNQDPSFFGWPFAGRTKPKLTKNDPYDQRLPDPIVMLRVYDSAGSLVITHDPFELNTVYYTRRSEIRVTVPPNVVQATPDTSILLMQISAVQGYDYTMDIFVPGSPKHATYLKSCNQSMPSGGRDAPRRFGWL